MRGHSKIAQTLSEEHPRFLLKPGDFGHPASVLRFWRKLAGEGLRSTPTPFYLFSADPIEQALDDLRVIERGVSVPVCHWFSCKTQPVPPLLRWWRRQGRPIEIVSEFEFRAARTEGFPPEKILVNGPAKHRWLPLHAEHGLLVNFDSMNEAVALLPLARKLNWTVGLRIHTREESDPEAPEFPTQFGMQAEEAAAALKRLQRERVRLETVHFHLRTNLRSPDIIERALNEVVEICARAKFQPKFLDCGGGVPPPHVLSKEGRAFDAEFSLAGLATIFDRTLKRLPSVRELWLENGRLVCARSGVLVTRILEVKERGGLRQLICDAGRTMSALISNWEEHAIFSIPERRGPSNLTAVCGPTCMAFDQLTRRPLPRALRPGDALVWMDAGAYHIPWETRFSHGASAVLWHEGGRVHRAREAESFAAWWGSWRRGWKRS